MNDNHDEKGQFASGAGAKAEAASKTARALSAQGDKQAGDGTSYSDDAERSYSNASYEHSQAAKAHEAAADAYKSAGSSVANNLKVQYHTAMAADHRHEVAVNGQKSMQQAAIRPRAADHNKPHSLEEVRKARANVGRKK